LFGDLARGFGSPQVFMDINGSIPRGTKSAWQSGIVLDDAQGGAVVAGVFKNWSHDRARTGQLWVWYQPAVASSKRR
jgi:hypothetical protein